MRHLPPDLRAHREHLIAEVPSGIACESIDDTLIGSAEPPT